MNDDLLQSLAINFPALMAKSTIEDIDTLPGWDNIITAMCETICIDYNTARLNYLDAKLHNSTYNGKYDCTYVETLSIKLRSEEDKLPILSAIKDRFAGITVHYIHTTSAEYEAKTQAVVDMAKYLSHRTCMVCGLAASNNYMQMKTLCAVHINN
jgi:hypothetical protein